MGATKSKRSKNSKINTSSEPAKNSQVGGGPISKKEPVILEGDSKEASLSRLSAIQAMEKHNHIKELNQLVINRIIGMKKK